MSVASIMYLYLTHAPPTATHKDGFPVSLTPVRTGDPVAARASEAWAMYSRADDPMPPWAALDYVQEACDDRRRCFVALCVAAVRGYEDYPDNSWVSAPQQVVRDIKTGYTKGLKYDVQSCRQTELDEPEPVPAWVDWFDRMDRTIDLVLALEAAI